MEFYTDKFRKIRKSKRIKITELAEKMGLNRNTLWLWEASRTKPTEKTVRFVAKLLEVPVNEISDLEPEETTGKIMDYDSTVSLLSTAAMRDSLQQENIQYYFFRRLQEQFKELNSIACLVSLFVNSIPAICYAKDINGKYIIANQAFLNNLSLKGNFSLTGKTDEDFFARREARKNTIEDEKVTLTGVPIVNKENYIPGTKKKKWGIINKIPVFDSEGNATGMIGYFVDITKRRKAEAKVKAFTSAFNEIDELVWIAKKAKNRETGSIQFDDFLYRTNSNLLKKICNDDEKNWSNEKIYEKAQTLILKYKDIEKYKIEEIMKKGSMEMRFDMKDTKGNPFTVKNKIYYDKKQELFIVISSEDYEYEALNKVAENLRKAGIDEGIIKKAIDVL